MATQPQINLSSELYRKFGTSISSDVQSNLDDINNSLSTIQNNFLPLAGGTMTGDLHLHNDTLDALYSPSISADQLLVGGLPLGSAAFQDVSAFDVNGAALFVQENSLPLSGGIMNQDASIAFQNGANLSQGTTDLGIGGNKGISLKCSVNYELNYQAGRLTNFEPDGATVRSLPLGSSLLFLENTNIDDFNNQNSIDPNARILHNANGDIMLDWSGVSLTGIGIDSTVDTEVYTSSANWNDVVTIVSNNSAIQWNYQGADVQALSGNWQDTLTTVANNSAIWLLSGLSVETDPIFTSWALTNSALFLRTYNTVQANSSVQWNYQGTDIKSISANWQNTYTKFSTQSANNLSVYSNVNSNSANWNSNYSAFNSQSANNSSVFSSVNSNSANWNSVFSYTNTNSSNNLSNYTTVNTNSSNWNSVYSNVNSNSASYLNTKNTVQANSAIWLLSGLSVETDPIFTSWATSYSGNYQNTLNTVQSNSSVQWNYQGTDIKTLTGVWQNASTTFGNQSANNLSVYSSVNTNSANWNSNYTSFNTQSGNNSSVFSNVNSNSANWNSEYTNSNTNSANWQNTFSRFATQSANNLSVFSNVNTNSAINWNYQGTDIKALTGNWQSGFTTYSTHSAVYVSTTDTGTVSNNMLVNNNINIANSAISLGGSISTSNILDGITNIQGSTLYRSVSGWTMLSPGTNGQFLQTGGVSANPSWQSVASGITVGTTTTNGASANDIIISDGSLVQKLTPGTGVSSALTNAVNITGGLLTYGIIGVSGTKVPLLNTANTFTTTQNFSSGIITSSTPAISITQTWNNSAVSFFGMKIAAICTSNAASDLLSVYGGIAGTSVGLRVTNAAGAMGVQVASIFDFSNQWSLNYFVNGLAMGSNKNIYWSSTVNYYDTGDIGFSRAGVGILKLSNIGTPTLPTSWQVINTYTSTTNYEAGVMDWQTTSNTLRIGSAVGSVSGIARDVSIIHGGAEKIHISAGGTAIGSAGTPHSLIKSGVVTLVAGVATVSDSNVKNTGTALTNSRIIINRMDDGGTPGDSYSITRINGTSFTITSKYAGATQVLDTSTVSWLMINP